MDLCKYLGHKFLVEEEQVVGFSRTIFFCRRCGAKDIIQSFNPSEMAPEHFQTYWRQQGVGFIERIKQWRYHEIIAAGHTGKTRHYEERHMERLPSVTFQNDIDAS